MEQKEERNVPWNRAIVVCVVALLCCFLWGSAFPGIKIGYEIFGIEGNQAGLQIMFAGMRFFLAGVMALVIGSVAYKRILLPKKTSWKPILHLSLLQTTLQYFFFYIGLGKTSGVKASIIEALNVFVALFVACLLFRQEKLKRNKILGSVLVRPRRGWQAPPRRRISTPLLSYLLSPDAHPSAPVEHSLSSS